MLDFAVVRLGFWRSLTGTKAGVVVALAASMCTPPSYEVVSSTGCNDGERNGTETDIDCGGSDCTKCMVGDRCRVPSDCVSLDCVGGVCREPHCSNLTMDQDEEYFLFR